MPETWNRFSSDNSATDLPFQITLDLSVDDREVIGELLKYPEGEQRDAFALEALRIGVLTIRRTATSFDADFIKRETDRLLANLRQQLQSHAELARVRIENSLGRYFDPDSGHFTERVRQLASADGEVGRMIRSLIDGEDSQLAKTMLAHIGESSPLMKQLNPNQSEGLLAKLRKCVDAQLLAQRETLLKEFSLDNSEGALCRLVNEITGKHGDFTKDMKHKIDDVVKEFSLDEENSALSRLVRNVNAAQETITKQFSLDNEESSLRRMQNHLEAILGAHIKSAADFQQEVKVALGKLITKRETEARGTQHGATFEEALLEYLARECQPRGELVDAAGDRVGQIKNCKVGDAVVELGPDSAAAGARIVVEAKEDASYNLTRARVEIEQARKNRDAQLGIFVFSQSTAPAHSEPLCRIGCDLFVAWDAEDPTSDMHLQAALEIARALCVRTHQNRRREQFDFTTIDRAVLDIEKRVNNLDEIRRSAETIQSSSDKILQRVRVDRSALEKQLSLLQACLGDLKQTLSDNNAALLTTGTGD